MHIKPLSFKRMTVGVWNLDYRQITLNLVRKFLIAAIGHVCRPLAASKLKPLLCFLLPCLRNKRSLKCHSAIRLSPSITYFHDHANQFVLINFFLLRYISLPLYNSLVLDLASMTVVYWLSRPARMLQVVGSNSTIGTTFFFALSLSFSISSHFTFFGR